MVLQRGCTGGGGWFRGQVSSSSRHSGLEVEAKQVVLRASVHDIVEPDHHERPAGGGWVGGWVGGWGRGNSEAKGTANVRGKSFWNGSS